MLGFRQPSTVPLRNQTVASTNLFHAFLFRNSFCSAHSAVGAGNRETLYLWVKAGTVPFRYAGRYLKFVCLQRQIRESRSLRHYYFGVFRFEINWCPPADKPSRHLGTFRWKRICCLLPSMGSQTH